MTHDKTEKKTRPKKQEKKYLSTQNQTEALMPIVIYQISITCDDSCVLGSK